MAKLSDCVRRECTTSHKEALFKNKKYAKDLVDVHLSDRGLTSLERFDEFPNLEVIWLNNNEVSMRISSSDLTN